MMAGARHVKTTATSIASTHAGLKLLSKAKNPAPVSSDMTVSKNEGGLPYSQFVRFIA